MGGGANLTTRNYDTYTLIHTDTQENPPRNPFSCHPTGCQSTVTKDFFAKERGFPWKEREGANESSYFFLMALSDEIETLEAHGFGNFATLDHLLNLGHLTACNDQYGFLVPFPVVLQQFSLKEWSLVFVQQNTAFLHIMHIQ